MRTHAMHSLESTRNRFGDFYFPTKIKIFGNPRKSLEILWTHFGYPGWFGRMSSSTRSVELEKSINTMLGGAIGPTESRNKLGMLVVMSLQLSMAIGGT